MANPAMKWDEIRLPLAMGVIGFAALVFMLAQLEGPHADGSNMRPSFAQQMEMVPDALAFVNGEPVLKSDIIALAVTKNLSLSQEDIDAGIDLVKELVEEVIQQKLLTKEALRRHLDKSEEVQSAIELSRYSVLSDRLLRQVVDQNLSEEVLQNLYNEKSRRIRLSEEVAVRHILVATRGQAEILSTRLKAGVDFAELAQRFSIDPASAAQGGYLDYFSRDEMDKKFSEVAFSLPVGAVSEPFKTRFGWHIIKVEDKRVIDAPSYEELRPKIVRFKTYEIIQNLINELRSKATIKYVIESGSESGDGASSAAQK